MLATTSLSPGSQELASSTRLRTVLFTLVSMVTVSFGFTEKPDKGHRIHLSLVAGLFFAWGRQLNTTESGDFFIQQKTVSPPSRDFH